MCEADRLEEVGEGGDWEEVLLLGETAGEEGDVHSEGLWEAQGAEDWLLLVLALFRVHDRERACFGEDRNGRQLLLRRCELLPCLCRFGAEEWLIRE